MVEAKEEGDEEDEDEMGEEEEDECEEKEKCALRGSAPVTSNDAILWRWHWATMQETDQTNEQTNMELYLSSSQQ